MPQSTIASNELVRREYRVMRPFARYPRLTVRQAALASGYPLTSEKYVLEALISLTAKHYLDSRRIPDDGTKDRFERRFYWYPREAGLRHLAEEGHDPLPRYDRHPQKKAPFLEHDLAVNDVLIACERFARASDGDVTIHSLTHDEFLSRQPVKIKLPRHKKPVNLTADGYVELTAFGEHRNWWIEVDRGTEHQKTWKEKVEAIIRYAQTRQDPLTVLVVTTNGDPRLVQLVTWTEEQAAAMGEGEWSDLFRFSLSEYVSDPIDFFCGDRWVRPKTYEVVPLIS